MIDPTIFSENLYSYISNLIPNINNTLEEVAIKAKNEGQPVVSKDAGYFLHLMTKIINPQKVLEVGCNIGYSALWIATALNDGILETIDVREDFTSVARQNFIKAGVSDKIIIHLAPALEVIPKLEGLYDMVFIDAMKKEYKGYLDLVLPKVRKGGLILVDNTIWSGRVVNEEKDPTTKAVDDFNKYMASHEQIDSLILSIGDGLTFGVKK